MSTSANAPTARPVTTRICAGNDVESICGEPVARDSALCTGHEEVRAARLRGDV